RLLHRGVQRADPMLLGAMVVSGFAIMLLRVLAAGTAEKLGQSYVTRVRLRIFERIMTRPGNAKRRLGVAMARRIGDLSSLRHWVSEGFAGSIVSAALLGCLTLGLPWIGLPATYALVGLIGLCVLGFALVTPSLRGYVREARRRRGRLSN